MKRIRRWSRARFNTARSGGVPWGISESAYNVQDLERNYQYRAFGVPGLGLKRGLGDDLVIAPYAGMLAAPLGAEGGPPQPRAAVAAPAWSARYGFYEAIDYTPERDPPGHPPAASSLPTYMAHHQGMSLVALDNALHDSPMQRRFHADPRVQAADLLLQERMPQHRAAEESARSRSPSTCRRRGCRRRRPSGATRRRTRSARGLTCSRTAPTSSW